MAKIGKWLLAGGVLLLVVAGICTVMIRRQAHPGKKTYAKSEEVFGNPLMGYAPSAWHEEVADDIRLLYMDITWAELEPEEGVYDWASIEQENQVERWRQEGKHLILRFVCDIPGEERHMDIPDWLYEKTGEAGTWYDGEYGKGFAPDYNNEELIACHAKAVEALGEHFGTDGLVAYVELGSLGHWGEWHVNYEEGIQRMPKEKIRDQYVAPWILAFPNAKLLMRRPFHAADQYGMGLYNDMAGHAEATEEWLQWIGEGGDYGQAEEEDALSPMPDFWKTAPSGGELTSSISMEELLQTNLDETVQLIRDSHTTFLGPKIADEAYPKGYGAVLGQMGYRIRILEAALGANKEETSLRLTWENDGVAPFYGDWPVYVYVENADGETIEKEPVTMQLPSLLPGIQMVTDTALTTQDLQKSVLESGTYQIWIGVEDPMTGQPALRLAMDAEYADGKNRLY